MAMLGNFSKKVRNALVLLRIVGPGVFFEQLRRQIYSRHIQIGLEKSLEANSTQTPGECKIQYSLRPGSPQDMDEILRKVTSESKESVFNLLFRRWLYDSGFHNWYIARTADTNDLCFIQSVISPDDNRLLDGDFREWFPRLNKDEFILEGAYTFEKYRGNRLCDSVASDIFEIFRKQGFKRVLTYIKSDNAASLRAAEKTGFKKFEQVHVLKILFFTMRKKPVPIVGAQLRNPA
jgi:L-amino acid N-acyltransferase YncA